MRIYSIKDIAFRFFKQNKAISLSSTISVILSTFVIITMVLFIFNAQQSLRNDVRRMYGDMDISVGYAPDYHNKTITKSFLDKIKSNPNVQSSSGVLIASLNIGSYKSVYTLGVDSDYLSKSRYHYTRTIHSNEIILNESLANTLNTTVGDKVLVEKRSFTVVQIIHDSNATGLTPDIAVMNRGDLKNILFKKSSGSEATYVLIQTKNGVDPSDLANEISLWDQGLRIELANDNEFLKSNLNSLNFFVYDEL